jgi:hypothetical protein
MKQFLSDGLSNVQNGNISILVDVPSGNKSSNPKPVTTLAASLWGGTGLRGRL